ncbi:FUSC family protein [Wohlfahrtiimonas chitiniclastica]|uniref:FUSC family protein n=1 Tax=Wohlfahrtiimonas chitiniclastica TaxID=400946 RepID=UPI001BCF3F48|nr:FUSC family protein [Wohlfahrtiimonas chitiniclastica]MBS7817925.1 FUSC family protein [Wohlfahrtiimonas chitiniclastica]MBS7825892.1 FUSC family protein [Wohlfahrtiimonas chitiniclastica]MDC7251509.1 hypothetical protein [Wohlfahrtiimonas chitiniclastica]
MKFIPHNFYCRDSFVFVGSMFISALIVYPFVGIQGGIAWTSFAVLCTYSLYTANEDRSNFWYVLFWMTLIISSTYVGRFLHLSLGFYLYLLAIAYCYYYFFGRDPVCDRAMRFIIILSTIGTTMPHVTKGLPLGSLIGTLTALVVCHLLMRKKYDLKAFEQGIFTHHLFKLQTNLIPRAVIYSLGMFACLLIPHYLMLDKIYWATLMFIMVLTPKADNVVHTTLLRFLGSLAAVILLYAIFQVAYHTGLQSHMAILVLILLFMFAFILPMCFGKDTFIVAFGTTCYSLTLVELAGFWHNPTYTLLIDRITETMIGGIVAIIAGILLKVMREQGDPNDP